MRSEQERNSYDVVVIGAGFSGLFALHRLRGMGLTVRVLEAADGVGGTWYWNRYPGARCDSESYHYSFSFDDDLQQEWSWTERYAGQPEILSYLEHVADRFDLRRDIEFGTKVNTACYAEETRQWTVSTDAGNEYSARFLISAVGCLSAANVPDIAGLDTFEGDWYHTGNWPHESVDFTGKRVGVVGTGSTGIQIIPELASTAAHLTVFQRTANFSVPAHNRPISADEDRQIKTNYPTSRAIQRSSPNGHPLVAGSRSALSFGDEERNAIYEEAWAKGGIHFRATFADLLTDRKANDTAAEFIRTKIGQIVSDPDTRERLTPRDHPYAAKRPPMDTHYFETFNRSNVQLVDVKSDPIQQITPTGVRTESGDYDLDAIVFATGFDAITGPLLKLDIRGTDGQTLREKWSDGPVTYLGLQMAGFPNLFTITGPGSAAVLGNAPTAIEQHVNWIADCIEHLDANGFTRIEATPEAEKDWSERVREAAEATLFADAKSWYSGANVPGKPQIFMAYAGGYSVYARHCEDVALHGYEGFVLSGSQESENSPMPI